MPLREHEELGVKEHIKAVLVGGNVTGESCFRPGNCRREAWSKAWKVVVNF